MYQLLSMVVCLHFKNISFHSSCTSNFPFHLFTAAGMISDLTSTDCTGLFPFCIIVHTFVSTILQCVVSCMLVAANVEIVF